MEKAVLEAGMGLGDGGFVRGEGLERGLGEEVSLAPSPISSGY